MIRAVSGSATFYDVVKVQSPSGRVREFIVSGEISAPFIHWIGILLYPRMKAGMDRAVDPLTKSAGRDFYRKTAWNRVTGWGDRMFR